MATVVTLVALVGLIAAVTMGAEMLDVSRKQTVAMQILRNEVENIHLQNWTTVSNLPPSGTITFNLLPASASITINTAGTGLSAGGVADQQSFALTNYTYSYAAPYTVGVFDDNTNLMSVAKEFTLTVDKTTVVDPITHVARPNLFALTYTVTWTAGNRRKTYFRTSSTYYGKTGLNLYYQK